MRWRDVKQGKAAPAEHTKPPKLPPYAPYPQKIKAFITDLFMIYTPILYIITYLIMDGKDDFQASQIAPLAAVSIYGVIYSIFLSKTGQTPGKKAYSIKVVDKHGKPLSFFKALLRYIFFLFSATSLIGILLPLMRKDKRALHDILLNCDEIEIEE